MFFDRRGAHPVEKLSIVTSEENEGVLVEVPQEQVVFTHLDSVWQGARAQHSAVLAQDLQALLVEREVLLLV